jgi:hypothetical protein
MVYNRPIKERMDMARRKKQVIEHDNPHKDWVIAESIKVNGRLVEKNTELSIQGESGRFLFIKHVQTPTCEWIDVLGGKNERHRQFRSFRPERIKRVHYKNKTRTNIG